MVHIRRAFGDALISVGSLLALILTIASFDDRVRQQIVLHMAGGPSAQVAGASGAVSSLAIVVFDAVRDQSIAHAPLVIFVVAGVVLLTFMLRS
jgi:hypothetical protein